MSFTSWIIVLLLGGVGYWATSFLISEARLGKTPPTPPPDAEDAAAPPPGPMDAPPSPTDLPDNTDRSR